MDKVCLILETFLAVQRLGGLQETTLVMKNSVLSQLRQHAGKNLLEIGRPEIMSFIARPELKDTSRSVYLANVRSFYNWAEDEGYLDENPCQRIKTPKRKRGVPRPIPPDDLVRAISQARPTVRCWLLLGAFAGLRCIEISRLRAEDLNLDSDPASMIIHGKGGHRALVPVHPVLASELKQWPKQGFLFPHKTKPGEHVTAGSVSKAVNDHLRALGISHTAHSTRHLFATTAYRESGHNLLLTRNLLRHASVATTQVYAQTDPVDAADVVCGFKYGLIEEQIA